MNLHCASLLCQGGLIRAINLREHSAGWSIDFRQDYYRVGEFLTLQRGGMKLFKSLDRAYSEVRALSIDNNIPVLINA